MKKSAALVPLLLGAMALSAFAQGAKVDTDPKNAETTKLTVSGGLDIWWVWRDRPLNAVAGQFGTYGAGEFRSEGIFHGHFTVRLDADLSEKVRVTVALDNKRVEGGGQFTDVLGANPEGLAVTVRQANISLGDVFTKDVSVLIGTNAHSFDVRNNGSCMFFDPAHSDSIFSNATGALGPGGAGFPTSLSDELQPVGLILTYATESIQLHGIFDIALIEGGAAKHDEAAYGLDFWYIFQGR